MKIYIVNEIFYSLQGEGKRAGQASVFVRFAACNMACDTEASAKSPGGFKCDTEFTSGRPMTAEQIRDESWRLVEASMGTPVRGWIVLTGGEPGLQVDTDLIQTLRNSGRFELAIETNGSVALPEGIDWITVSPKVAEHAIEQKTATEVKYVRGYGQGIPKTVVDARYYLISPAFSGMEIDQEALAWCIKLCKENPKWELSIQNHKIWRVR